MVKAAARDQGITMGELISDLILRHRAAPIPEDEYTEAGFLAINTKGPVTNEDVKRLEAEEDEYKLRASGWTPGWLAFS